MVFKMIVTQCTKAILGLVSYKICVANGGAQKLTTSTAIDVNDIGRLSKGWEVAQWIAQALQRIGGL